MADELPQVDNVTGLPMVDAATDLPDVSDNTGNCCDCGGASPTYHCFQQWQVTWDCVSLAWGAVTAVAGQKKCLAIGTSTAWSQFSSTATTCTYRRWVDTGTACTVDGDCTALADTAAPAVPTKHVDCCQTCCNLGGACCFSDFSAWTVTLPTLVADPNYTLDAQQTLDIAWWNAGMAGQQITLSFVGCGRWVYDTGVTVDGYEVIVTFLTFGWAQIDWVTPVGSNWHWIWPRYAYTDTSSCCRDHGGGNWYTTDTVVWYMDSGPDFNIIDNFCCLTTHSDTDPCQKQPGTCDGRCNFLP